MQIVQTEFPEVLILKPKVFEDDRGFFYESYNQKMFSEMLGIHCDFVQDNHSRSAQHVLRGLHYQIKHAQGKLVRVVVGEVYDVVVDLRGASSSLGKWIGVRLSAANKHQLWVPAGFAHGFLVLSKHAEVLYKTTDFYAPEYERCIRWDDPLLAISWPLEKGQQPIISEKDGGGLLLEDTEFF